MPKLYPDSHLSLNKNILAQILKSYNLQFKSFKLAKNGIQNTTALIKTNEGEFALRIYSQKSKSLKQIRQELQFMKYVKQRGLKQVPKIFKDNKNSLVSQHKYFGKNWKVILMQRMPGKASPVYSKRVIKDLAAASAKMHKLGMAFSKKQPVHKKVKSLYIRKLLKCIKINKLKNREFARFLKRAEKFYVKLDKKLPAGFCHFDFDLYNCLVKNNHLSAILDFDDAVYSPLVVCLGISLWDILYEPGYSEKKIKLYAKVYENIRPLSSLEKTYLPNAILYRNYIVACVETILNGEKHPGNLKKFLRIEKLILKENSHSNEYTKITNKHW